MSKNFLVILALLPGTALLASCGAKPTLVPPPPAGAIVPASAGSAAVSTAPPGSRAMFVPSNPKRPANIPALGIPVNARHSLPTGP